MFDILNTSRNMLLHLRIPDIATKHSFWGFRFPHLQTLAIDTPEESDMYSWEGDVVSFLIAHCDTLNDVAFITGSTTHEIAYHLALHDPQALVSLQFQIRQRVLKTLQVFVRGHSNC